MPTLTRCHRTGLRGHAGRGRGVTSPAVRPGWAQASRRSGSIRRPFIGDRSRTIPPSDVPWPARLWPPLRTASSRPVSAARSTVRETSAASAARTTTSGRGRSAAVVDLARPRRSASSPGTTIVPLERVAAKAASVVGADDGGRRSGDGVGRAKEARAAGFHGWSPCAVLSNEGRWRPTWDRPRVGQPTTGRQADVAVATARSGSDR